MIVSVLVAGTVPLAMSASAEEDTELLHTVEIGVHLDMDTAIMDIIEDDDLDLFMHGVDGVVWMQGPPVWFEELDTWEVHGSYNNLLLNPSREGDETEAMLEALDAGWIEDPDEVRWLANNADGDWTINPFAHNDIRFALNYISREGMIEDLLDGLGTSRYGWMDSRLPVWQEHFVQSIEQKYDFTPEGDEAFMEDIVQWAMEEIQEEVAFGEVTGSMDEGWYYEHEESDTEEHQIEIIGIARIEDWRVDLAERVNDMLEDMGFDTTTDERDGAGSIPLVFDAAPDPYDEVTWHFYTGGWVATTAVAWPDVAANQMYNPWYGFMHAQGPTEHWNYDEEGYRDTVGPSSRVREELEAGAEEAGEDIWAHEDVTIEEMDAYGMALDAAEFDDIDEYWEMLTNVAQRGIEESVRVFMTTGIDFYPYDGDAIGAMVIESVNGYDTYFGPRTMQVEDGELGATLLTGIDRPFMDNWNLYGGSDDVYTIYPQRMMREKPNWPHPRTGLSTETINYWSEGPDLDPKQGEWDGEIYYGPEDDPMEQDVEIPEDAVDYDPVANEWVEAEAEYSYVKATYDTYEEHVWHCGTEFSVKDIMAWHARERRLAEDDNIEEDYEDIYYAPHEALSGPNFGSIQALEFDEDAGTYSVYTNYNFPDESQIGGYHSYAPETHPLTYEVWDHLHGGTSWQDYAEDDWADDTWHYEAGMDVWIHQIAEPQVRNAVIPIMEEMIEQEYVPAYYTEGEVPIDVDTDDVIAEMENLVEFMDDTGHSYVGLGPFYMTEYDEEVQELHLERHEDYGFDFDQDWDPDSEYEDGYWSERFHIVELALTDMIVPRFVDMADGPFEAITEGSMSELFPEVVDDPITEADVEEYEYVLYDEAGDEVATVDEEDIELDEQATWSEFIAEIPVDDAEIGYHDLEFRALPEGEVAFETISSEVILLFDPDLTYHTFEFAEELIGLDEDFEATAELDVEIEADEGDTAIIELFDDEDEVVDTWEEELGEGESFDDTITYELEGRDAIGDYRAEGRDADGNIIGEDEFTVLGANPTITELSFLEQPAHAQALQVDETLGTAPHEIGITAEGYNPGAEWTANPAVDPAANILMFNDGNQAGDVTIQLDGEEVAWLEAAGGSGVLAADWDLANFPDDIPDPVVDDDPLHYIFEEAGDYTLEIVAEYGWTWEEGEDPIEYGEPAGEEVLEEIEIEVGEEDLEDTLSLVVEDDVETTDPMGVDESYTIEHSYTYDEAGLYDVFFGHMVADDFVPQLDEEVHVSWLDVIDFSVEEDEFPVDTPITFEAEVENVNDAEEVVYFYIGDEEIYNETIPAEETAEIEFEHEFVEIGGYDIALNDDLGTLDMVSVTAFPDEASLTWVEDLDYTLDEAEATITGEIDNEGFGEADDVELTLEDEDEEIESWEYTIEERGELTIEETHVFDEAGEYTATLTSEYIEDQEITIVVEGEINWIENLAVNGEEDEITIETDETVDITAEVENVGEFDIDIELMVNDEEIGSWTIGPGEDESIDETYTFDEEGDYTVSLYDQEVDVTVMEPGEVELEEFTVNEEDEEVEIELGDEVEIYAEVYNGLLEEVEMTVWIEDEDGDIPAGPHEYEETIAAGETGIIDESFEEHEGWWTGDYVVYLEVEDYIDESIDVTVYEELDYELEIDSTDGGEVVEPGEGGFEYEEDDFPVDLEAEADDDYEFVEWTGDTDYIEDTDEAETIFELPDEEGTYSITAEFEEEDEPELDMMWIIVIVVIVIIIIALVAMAMMKKPPAEEEEFEEEFEEEDDLFEEEEEDLFEEEAEEEDLFEEEEEDLFDEEAEEEDLFEEEEPEEEL